MKKIYMMPSIDVTEVQIDTLLEGGSTLDPTKDSQEVTPVDDEYDGEFGGNRNRYSWDDDED